MAPTAEGAFCSQGVLVLGSGDSENPYTVPSFCLQDNRKDPITASRPCSLHRRGCAGLDRGPHGELTINILPDFKLVYFTRRHFLSPDSHLLKHRPFGNPFLISLLSQMPSTAVWGKGPGFQAPWSSVATEVKLVTTEPRVTKTLGEGG